MRKEAPAFVPSAAAAAPASRLHISFPELFQEAQTVYDSQLLSYTNLVESQNCTIAKLTGMLDKCDLLAKDEETSSRGSSSHSSISSRGSRSGRGLEMSAELSTTIDDKISSAVNAAVLPEMVDEKITGAIRGVYQSFPVMVKESIQNVVDRFIESVLSKGVDDKLVKCLDVIEASEQNLERKFSARVEQLTVQIADIESELRALRRSPGAEDTQSNSGDWRAKIDEQIMSLQSGLEQLMKSATRPPSNGSGLGGRSSGAGVCKYGKACHRRDCVFDHPQGRTIDEISEKAKASSASQPPSG